MDEGHHLTRPHPLYSVQLKTLRELVYRARNTVFALCTGTMAEDSVRDPRSLLDGVKGQEKAMLNDEGFLSSHHVRGRGFPTERPHGVSDGALTDAVENQLVHRVKLHGEAHNRHMFQEIRRGRRQRRRQGPPRAAEARTASAEARRDGGAPQCQEAAWAGLCRASRQRPGPPLACRKRPGLHLAAWHSRPHLVRNRTLKFLNRRAGVYRSVLGFVFHF